MSVRICPDCDHEVFPNCKGSYCMTANQAPTQSFDEQVKKIVHALVIRGFHEGSTTEWITTELFRAEARARSEAEAARGEPVAWINPEHLNGVGTVECHVDAIGGYQPQNAESLTPLYTSAPNDRAEIERLRALIEAYEIQSSRWQHAPTETEEIARLRAAISRVRDRLFMDACERHPGWDGVVKPTSILGVLDAALASAPTQGGEQ